MDRRRRYEKEAQRLGRVGGLARKKGKKSYHELAHCAGCGKQIDARNKSGMCVICLRKARAATKKATPTAICKHCGGPARKGSVTGYCYKCYRESLHWESRQQEHADWVSVNVCGKDAKTRQSRRKQA